MGKNLIVRSNSAEFLIFEEQKKKREFRLDLKKETCG